jgi:murein L,D-transpeptidase YcbB/YkuD
MKAKTKTFKLILKTLVFICLALQLSCREKNNPKLTKHNVYQNDTDAILDSTALNKNISSDSIYSAIKTDIIHFYRKRNFTYAWLDAKGMNEYAYHLLNLIKQDSLINNKNYRQLDSIATIFEIDLESHLANNNKMQIVELQFTRYFFAYARNNWGGLNKKDGLEVGWFIQKGNIKYDDLLDSILKQKPISMNALEPYNKQYALLKKELLKFKIIEKENDFISARDSIPILAIGSVSEYISQIKKQLFSLGDLKQNDLNDSFNEVLKAGIIKYQTRNGITSNGLLNKTTIQSLKIPIHERIEQIIINMERCKWVPQTESNDYVLINIPAYKLYVYHNQSLEWSCNVVVGKSKLTSNTIIFNDQIEYIVFSPYWNVTPNIITKELLPILKRNPNYLKKLNMEVVDRNGKYISSSSINWHQYQRSFPYIIRQKPGKNNSLGKVKFIFPNRYDIYMHDTPQKSLFNEQNRSFSHGCIRVEKPFELAKFLLRDMPNYNDILIRKLMNSAKEKYVRLQSKAPVFIVYFTAWVSNEGILNFRDDIYDHDSKMRKLLFGKK